MSLINKKPKIATAETKQTSWNQEQGLFGEKLAEKFLKKNGYTIVARRYRTRVAEIDIIAKKSKSLYFIEVKTRTNERFGHPLEALHTKKIDHLQKGTHLFLKKHPHLLKKYSIQLAAISVIHDGEDSQIKMVLILP